MAGNQQEGGLGVDFFEQILAVPPGYGGGEVGSTTMPMMLQLGSSGGVGGEGLRGVNMGMEMMPLGLNLAHRFLRQEDGVIVDGNNISTTNNNASSSTTTTGINLQAHSVRPSPPPPPQPGPSQLHQPFYSQPTQGAVVPHPPGIRPRVRARRGQATDPHSIDERLRRERIAERMKALQELVPSCNKTDKAAMLDEIVEYVKFLRLQVKVLSMSRLGAAGAVAQLAADVPLSSVEGEDIERGINQPAWEKWSNDGTEQQVAKLMEEDIGAAMQFLQTKALCIMPISLASAIFRTHQPDPPTLVKPESNSPFNGGTRAAKEFESELKKEPDSLAEPPEEKTTAVSEEEKQDVKVSSSKESV